MKILIIGGGNMGQTFARSFLSTHIVGADQMFILEKSPEKAKELEGLHLGTVYGEPGAYVQQSDLIILAVKPQDFPVLATTICNYIDNQQVVLSIMAGVKIASIQQHLGTAKVVRAMPNLPAQTGSGMTVFTSSTEVTRIDIVTVQHRITATGNAIYLVGPLSETFLKERGGQTSKNSGEDTLLRHLSQTVRAVLYVRVECQHLLIVFGLDTCGELRAIANDGARLEVVGK